MLYWKRYVLLCKKVPPSTLCLTKPVSLFCISLPPPMHHHWVSDESLPSPFLLLSPDSAAAKGKEEEGPKTSPSFSDGGKRWKGKSHL